MLRTDKRRQIAYAHHMFAHHTVALQAHLEILLQSNADLQRIKRIQTDRTVIAKQKRIVGEICLLYTSDAADE